MIACLREADATKIITEQHVVSDMYPSFGPVVDGKWLRDDPKKMLQEHQFKKCPIMAGVTANEGAYFMIYSLPELMDLKGLKMNQDQLKSSIQQLFKYNNYDYPNMTVTCFKVDFIFTQRQSVAPYLTNRKCYILIHPECFLLRKSC